MPRGGKRPGAGRPKGSFEPKRLEKEAAREVLRDRVKADIVPMVDAQIAHAKGLKFLVYRDKKSGKFERVKAEDDLARLQERGVVVEAWDKDPSVQAFTDLMNRTLDKPQEHLEIEHSGAVGIIEERIKAGRDRLARAK